MSVYNGQKVDQSVTNAAFISRTTDSNTTGKVDLENADAASGANISNTQRSINGAHSFSGSNPNGLMDQTPTWATNNYGLSTDNLQERAEAHDVAIDANETNIATNTQELVNVRTTLGSSFGATDMGTYSGSTISDNVSQSAINQELETAVEDRIPLAQKGAADGVAPLNASSKIDALYLPSYVDDVEEYADLASFPVTGESGKIYVAIDTLKTYRWTGTVYVEISASDVNSVNGQTGVVVLDTDDIAEGPTNLYFNGKDTDDLPEGTTNEYYTDAKADARADARIAAASIDDLADVDTTTLPPANGDALIFDGSNWVPGEGGGSGSGVGGRSFYSDFACEDIAKFGIYDDGASATPTDGTGAVVSGVSIALETVAPLAGTSSYKFTKDAGSQLGKGFKFVTDIALDADIKAGTPLTMQMLYSSTANYVNGDVKLFAYLVGSNQLIALNGYSSIMSTPSNDLNADQTNRGFFQASFNASASDTVIRILGHVATANANAYDLLFDNCSIGPTAQVFAGINTKTEYWVPTYVGFGAAAHAYARWWRENEWLHFDVQFSTGTPTGVSAYFTLPNNLVPVSGTGTTAYAGEWKRTNTNEYTAGAMLMNTASGPYIYFGHAQSINGGAAGAPTAVAQGTQITGGGEKFIMQGKVQIAGWSSGNTISSTQANFQNVSIRYGSNAGQSVAGDGTPQVFNFQSLSEDKFNLVTNPSTDWKFTAPFPMKVKVNARLFWNNGGGWNAGEYHALDLYKNTGTFSSDERYVQSTHTTYLTNEIDDEVSLNTGDYIQFKVRQTSGSSLNTYSSTTYTWVTITQIPDLTVVGISGAPSEYQSISSSIKTPAASGHWLQMTGNSLTLLPGEWEITGYTQHYSDPTNAGYDFLQTNLRSANGADSVTAPGSLLTIPGLTIKGINNDQCFSGRENNIDDGSRNYRPIYISITSTSTIYAVPYVVMSVPANSRVITYLTARRLK